MNQPLLLMILSELCIVLLMGLIALLAVGWRHKRRRQADIEALLDDIEDGQEQRGNRLVLAMIAKYRLDEQLAQALSESLILAEKQFLHRFVEQQVQQQLSGFYEDLCRLLDSYLDSMPKVAEKPVAEEPAVDTEEQLADTDSEQPKPVDSDATPAEEAPPPPDWGDVFD